MFCHISSQTELKQSKLPTPFLLTLGDNQVLVDAEVINDQVSISYQSL